MSATPHKEVKILVVDDDPAVLAGNAHLLERAGYVVLRAGEGPAVLQAVREHRPDLVLLDRNLGDRDGIEICRQIKGDPGLQDVLVVIISGSAVATAEQAEGLEGGADGYISRPIGNRELLARVAAFVRIARLSRTLIRKEREAQQAAILATRSNQAALNLMEDAIEAQKRLEAVNAQLRSEIAERTLAQAALRDREQHYRLLFDQNPLALWVYEVATLRFLAVNESAVQRYGFTRDEFLGLTLPRICHEEDVARLRKRIAAENDSAGATCELRHRRKDGSVVFVETFSRPLVFAGQNCRLSLVTDVTEKKVLEEKFLRAQRLESLGMLAAGIAHDLNNVLAPIIFAAPILRGNLSTPRDLKILETLERSAERGAGLVKQILGFVRTASGELRPLQVKHVLRDLISVIEETFPKSIRFEHSVPSALWLVMGNATQIHQVVLNLCVNARDAMSSGGVLRLTASNRELSAAQAAEIPGATPGEWLVLEIADTGTGIAPEALQHIWTPFFTTKGAERGTGLGLTTVRSIVSGHNGCIELQTALGQGTTFRIFLPAIDASQPGADAAASPAPRGRGQLVVVVDDDAAIRELVTEILESHNYRVVSCADGMEAMTLFATRATEISALVTDLDMPHLGGVELAEALIPLYPQLKIIAMSGLSKNPEQPGAKHSLRELVHASLNKPFPAEEMLTTLDRVLRPDAKA